MSGEVVEAFRMDGGGVMVTFECPGCRNNHGITVGCKNKIGAEWTWNGDLVKPTIHPSVLSRIEFPRDPVRDTQICHSFIRDGQIQFLDDCTHSLSGQTVALEVVK